MTGQDSGREVERLTTEEYLGLREAVTDGRFSAEAVGIAVRNLWPKIYAAIQHSEHAHLAAAPQGGESGWRTIDHLRRIIKDAGPLLSDERVNAIATNTLEQVAGLTPSPPADPHSASMCTK